MIYLIVPYHHSEYYLTPFEKILRSKNISYSRYHNDEIYNQKTECKKLINSDFVVLDDSKMRVTNNVSIQNVTSGAKKQILFCFQNNIPVYYKASTGSFGKIDSIDTFDCIRISDWFGFDVLLNKHMISNDCVKQPNRFEYKPIPIPDAYDRYAPEKRINYLLISTGLGV